jgi:hypothetical protein
MRRQSEREAARSAEQLGRSAAQVVVASQQNAKTIRRLTWTIAAATIVVIYSALR